MTDRILLLREQTFVLEMYSLYPQEIFLHIFAVSVSYFVKELAPILENVMRCYCALINLEK
jgi:hypothetical protein